MQWTPISYAFYYTYSRVRFCKAFNRWDQINFLGSKLNLVNSVYGNWTHKSTFYLHSFWNTLMWRRSSTSRYLGLFFNATGKPKDRRRGYVFMTELDLSCSGWMWASLNQEHVVSLHPSIRKNCAKRINSPKSFRQWASRNLADAGMLLPSRFYQVVCRDSPGLLRK